MFWHKHKWRLGGVHHMFEINTYLRDIKKPVTEVLFVCPDCHQTKTETLTGHWSLEELTPKPTEKDADKEFFRKLGVKI